MGSRGKYIGGLIGLIVLVLTRRPWALVIGLALGQLYDMGLLGGASAKSAAPPAPPPAVPQDPYATLGVSSSATDDEVEQAYRRRMSEYHPDRVANAAQEIRDLAGLRAGEANAAYETIKRQRGR
jgi:DnaJ-domain-containing protein 1